METVSGYTFCMVRLSKIDLLEIATVHALHTGFDARLKNIVILCIIEFIKMTSNGLVRIEYMIIYHVDNAHRELDDKTLLSPSC